MPAPADRDIDARVAQPLQQLSPPALPGLADEQNVDVPLQPHQVAEVRVIPVVVPMRAITLLGRVLFLLTSKDEQLVDDVALHQRAQRARIAVYVGPSPVTKQDLRDLRLVQPGPSWQPGSPRRRKRLPVHRRHQRAVRFRPGSQPPQGSGEIAGVVPHEEHVTLSKVPGIVFGHDDPVPHFFECRGNSRLRSGQRGYPAVEHEKRERAHLGTPLAPASTPRPGKRGIRFFLY